MPKNVLALKKISLFARLAGLSLILAFVGQAAFARSEPRRAFCRAPGLSWSLVLDFNKFEANSADGESEISFLSGQPGALETPGQFNQEASYRVTVHKVSQFPEVDFDSYRVVFGDEQSNFIVSLPRERKGKSILTRAYLSTDGETQNLACSVALQEPDSLTTALDQDIERKRRETKVQANQLPPQVCAIDYLNEKSKQYEFGCSATIVSHRDVLTADHCQQIYDGRPAQARCPGQPTIAIDLKKSSRHEKHVEDTWKVAYDIAILRLSQDVSTLPAQIAPDTDAVRETIFAHPESCALYGYGRELDGKINRLHGVRFQFPPEDLGGRAFTEANFEDEHMISSDPRLFLRGGDSGGPVLCGSADAPVIVGVHSILFALDSSANSSSVGFNSSWIHEHISQATDDPNLVLQAAADAEASTSTEVSPPVTSRVTPNSSADDEDVAPAPIHLDDPQKVNVDGDDAPMIESTNP